MDSGHSPHLCFSGKSEKMSLASRHHFIFSCHSHPRTLGSSSGTLGSQKACLLCDLGTAHKCEVAEPPGVCELRAHLKAHVMVLTAVPSGCWLARTPPLCGPAQWSCSLVLWSLSGDHRCFLFSILPSMAVHTCTGYNDHYMYLSQGQRTIPNGLVRTREGPGCPA